MRTIPNFVFTVDQVRRGEQVLLEQQTEQDQLMKEAARAVAAAAQVMLHRPRPNFRSSSRVLLLVGSGGNGGDALYAGALLQEVGHGVDAVLLGRAGKVREPSLAAFEAAGGQVLDTLPDRASLSEHYALIIDGILGMGGRGGISPEVAEMLSEWLAPPLAVLAIDVPSGIDADTGALPDQVEVSANHSGAGDDALRIRRAPAHVKANVTITFGGLRPAHAVAHDCGEVIVADLKLATKTKTLDLGQSLFDTFAKDFSAGAPEIQAERAWPEPEPRYDWAQSTSVELRTVRPGFHPQRTEPAVDSDKYSGGVVGICAGSDTYRGAAVLCTAGAVRATSSLVRYVGSGWAEVVRALPEVIAHDGVDSAGRVQSWVVGPGRGTDASARAELAQLLDRPEALVIDADAITLLAQHAELRKKLHHREGLTLLTPHAGEFRRLADAMITEIPDPDVDRLGAARAMAVALDCGVLLKGRRTVIAYGIRVRVIDAGSSWGATAGSGDVLAGIAGALLAQEDSRQAQMKERYPAWRQSMLPDQYVDAENAVRIHSVAAALAAQTPEGMAPTSASKIAAAIPRANAWFSARRDQ